MGLTIGYLCVMFLFPFKFLTLILQSIVLVPQICSSTKRLKSKLSVMLILLVVTRSLFPLYVKGCPRSLFQLSQSYGFCSLWVSSIIFQVLIIYLQKRLGGRFFIPRCCLPIFFKDGYIRMDETLDLCSICL